MSEIIEELVGKHIKVQPAIQVQRNRLLKVFEFLKAYLDLRYPPVRAIREQLRTLWLKELPQHPSVVLLSGSADADEQSDGGDVVLRITRPNLTSCPPPPSAISDWVRFGWEEITNEVEFSPSRNVPDNDGRARIERFDEVPQRPVLFRQWREDRTEWQVNEQPARQALALFQSVYEWFGIHEREAERIEILVGDGLLHCPDAAGDFEHPVLFQRLALEFYPEKRSPQFVFRRREQPPELYEEFLRALPEVNHEQIGRCKEELQR